MHWMFNSDQQFPNKCNNNHYDTISLQINSKTTCKDVQSVGKIIIIIYSSNEDHQQWLKHWELHL